MIVVVVVDGLFANLVVLCCCSSLCRWLCCWCARRVVWYGSVCSVRVFLARWWLVVRGVVALLLCRSAHGWGFFLLSLVEVGRWTSKKKKVRWGAHTEGVLLLRQIGEVQ
jgi:hypothetical protein